MTQPRLSRMRRPGTPRGSAPILLFAILIALIAHWLGVAATAQQSPLGPRATPEEMRT